MKRIDLIAGARPNFMKIAPIIDAIKDARARGCTLDFRLVHTGQHYDQKMSGEFFQQLGIPEPDINLEVGSGTQAEQTANIMIRYEKVLNKKEIDLCVVVGDVTSTMACAIVARKMGVPVAHVEGGIRSWDWTMPEEINRVVTDSITNYFFTTSTTANQNLQKAGVTDDRIFFVGNTMIDTLLKHMSRLRPAPIWSELELTESNYLVATLHRPANVDNPAKLSDLLNAIQNGSRGLPIIFPVHPRTRKMLSAINKNFDNIKMIDPLGYLEFNHLVKYAKTVITDSGGITEETTVMGIPCLTMRDNTERPETITIGTNELIGTDPKNLAPALEKLFKGQWKTGKIPEYWDGHASERIVAHIEKLLA
jgi:UDP-N-acetylglucosamine 2-epimerase (non-hydrolysing)